MRGVTLAFSVAANHEGGSHPVLSGVDLDIYRGERLGIVGRNGVGKSTLLRILAGIYNPQHGDVQRAAGISVALLSLGLGFNDQLTGRDNAFLAGMLQGLSRSGALASVAAIEAFCDLGVYFDEPVKSYSSGMRARLGFGTALLNAADVILIDETLSVGDQVFKHKAEAALTEQLSDERAAVLVSHNPGQLRAICTRLLWLDGGVVRMSGDPGVVLAAYEAAARPSAQVRS